jgi:predicted ATPase/DNA-binding SARP family transcriptional activator
MSRLALYFLGPPRIYLDGSAVKIGRRKVLALLAYLAVTSQRHSRDELAELLFGERDREHSRADIRQTLSLLGDAIGEQRLGADRQGVWLLCGKGLWIDVAEFRRLLESGHAAERQGDLSTAQSCLAKAVGLFRGEFLSGFYLKHNVIFEAWQLGEQESLRNRQASALRWLTDIHEARGQYEQAIDLARRWLALDPLEEAIHRQLMRLHGLAGQHSEALRQYEKCKSMLERELREKPGSETERLRERIASGRLLPGDEGRQGRSTQTPLFLFGQLRESEEEQARRQEVWLRETIGTARGLILGMAGRMLCAVLATPQAAVRAALAAQRGEQSAPGAVRAVLLAEESRLQREAPSPVLVARAETILEASHPGQVLLSETAARLVGAAALSESAALRCLGSHRLKDLGAAQTLYQLEHQGLPREFPSLKTLDDQPNNLQIQPTPFIGREEELSAVEEALQPEDARLLTLTGAAGTGKTRLALQAAAALAGSFAQGVFFVDLSGLREPAQVSEAIAATLGVREIGGDVRTLLETLMDFLRGKRMLLLLDNFEHLLSAAPLVAQLLANCSRLKVLATSREALRLRAERLFPVPPMRLPSQGQRAEVIKNCEAVRLFAERAEAVRPDFELSGKNVEAVAEICIRLDGLPLAIELAATHIRVLTPQALLARLRNRLELLREGPCDLPARQQTLRGEVDWSHELLGEDERRIFRRLSVFPGGCTQDAAEAVCLLAGEDLSIPQGLSSLAEKNLVKPADLDGEIHFRMLETIREYALERLAESGEQDIIEPRFTDYYLRFAEQAETRLYGPEQESWFKRIEGEYDNIRAALAWLRDRGTDPDALRLAGALGWFWFRRGRFSEGQYWLEQLRSGGGQAVPSGIRAKAAYYLGWMKLCAGSFWGNPEGKEFFRESLRFWRESGNRRGIALSQVWLGWETGDVEGADAQALADDSVALARETGDPWAISLCLRVAYANLCRPDKDLDARRAALEEAIALARKTEDPFLLCQALTGMGNVFASVGELEAAEPWYREALGVARNIKDTWSILDSMNCLADAYLGLGQTTKAKELFGEGLRLAVEQAARGYLGWFIGGLYGVAKREGRAKRAARLGSVSESLLNPGRGYDPGYARGLGLDEKAARAEWAAGKAMTLEQAVAYALSDE